MEWLNAWANYPGLELWKFLNLAIFTAFGIYILRRPIAEALASRREDIKQELLHAQQEKARALEKVAETDSLLSKLDDDVRAVKEHSRQEVELEKQRVAGATAREIEKLKQQSEREMETADKIARKELRRFFAQRSVEFARDRVRREMKPEDDQHLIEDSIGELRRARV